MQNNTEETFRKLHQEMFVLQLEEEISSLIQVDWSLLEKEKKTLKKMKNEKCYITYKDLTYLFLYYFNKYRQ